MRRREQIVISFIRLNDRRRKAVKYAALFRGINVGGKNIVKMDELKQLFSDLGLLKTKTYIQSGNAVFETDLDEASVQTAINTGFEERFGFKSKVIIRDINEIGALVARLPFSAEELASAEAADPQVEHLYIYFLEHKPTQAQLNDLGQAYVGPDALQIGDRDLYLLCHQSIRQSKLAIRTAKEFNSATVRNWNTVSKLYDMLCAL